MKRCDLVVIGLGTAGAATAARAAARGLSVIGLDARPLDRAGARWVNGIPGWSFREAGFELPQGEELRGEKTPFHLVAGWGPHRLTLLDHDVLEVDMRLLVARLQGLARDAGAELLQGKVRGLHDDILETDLGPIQARWVVDASGMGGAGLLQRPRATPPEICVAAQEVRRVRDRQAVAEYFAANDAREGETLCYSAVAGGYSIVSVHWKGDEIALLTGSVPALGLPSGRQLLDRFASEHPWVGDVIFGGTRPIPLRLTHTRLGEGRVALVGDAACQVYAMHGSGIGAGMIAGRMVADVLADGGTPEDYNYRWQRTWGGLLAGACVFARYSAGLRSEHLVELMNSGLMAPAMSTAALDQRSLAPSVGNVLTLLRGVLTSPRLAVELAPMVARIGATYALYAMFPKDPAKIAAFEARALSLLPPVGASEPR